MTDHKVWAFFSDGQQLLFWAIRVKMGQAGHHSELISDNVLTFQETDMSQYPPKCPGGEGAEIQSLPLSICELKTFGGE